MERRNKIALIVLVIITLIAIGACVYSLVTNKFDESDASKFRTEYMELNDKVNESLDLAYPNVLIEEDNTVKYLSSSEAVKLLENGTGVVYFGFNTCPWCRSLVPILTDVAKEKNEVIYYLNIANLRSAFTLKDGEVKNTKKGSKDYYKILELLDDYLEEYYLEDEHNNSYDTLEKRLLAPTVVAVSKGEVTDIHVGTISSQASGYNKLTEDQISELENIISKLIDSKNNEDSCVQDAC